MDEFLIRPIEPSDQRFLWEMLYHAIHVSEGQEPPPRDIIYQPELAKYVEDWGRPGDLGSLAEDAETHAPVAAAWIRQLAGDHRGYGWVSDEIPELSVAALPGYRGRGLGTRLIEHALQLARQQYAAVSLSVSTDNRAAALYRRLGFVEVGRDEGGALVMLLRF